MKKERFTPALWLLLVSHKLAVEVGLAGDRQVHANPVHSLNHLDERNFCSLHKPEAKCLDA